MFGLWGRGGGMVLRGVMRRRRRAAAQSRRQERKAAHATKKGSRGRRSGTDVSDAPPYSSDTPESSS